MEIDVTYVSDTFAPIGNAINNENCEWIKGVKVTDTYVDDKGKAITVRIYFAHPERTLTKEEVMKYIDSISLALEKENIYIKK